MTRKLSERQKALRTIAEAYETVVRSRTKEQKTLALYGICDGMYKLGVWDISVERHNPFLKALKESTGNDWLCPVRAWPKLEHHTRSCDLWRSDLASLLAAMTDEEYNEAFGVE